MHLAELQQYVLERLVELMSDAAHKHSGRERYVLDGGEVDAQLAALSPKQAIVRGLQGASIRIR